MTNLDMTHLGSNFTEYCFLKVTPFIKVMPFDRSAPWPKWLLLLKWRHLTRVAPFIKVTPFDQGGAFYKSDPFWPKWRLLSKWRPLTRVATFIKVTPFHKVASLIKWCLLTEVTPGTDMAHLADVTHFMDCTGCLLLCQSWFYLLIEPEY